MQSAPTETSQNATSVESSHDNPSPSQHGLLAHSQPVSDRLSGDREPQHPVPPDTSDTVSVSSGSTATSRGRDRLTRRLSERTESSNASSSPGSRIDEYERKHARRSKKKDGLVFQVVPLKSNGDGGVAIEEFPNGMVHRPWCIITANTSQKF
jgi:hypothetical protein